VEKIVSVERDKESGLVIGLQDFYRYVDADEETDNAIIDIAKKWENRRASFILNKYEAKKVYTLEETKTHKIYEVKY
jgi:hypothetical protein